MTRILFAACVLAALALSFQPAAAAQQPIPVILDTDMGDDIDDALALSLAVQSPELKVLAVNTVLQNGQRRADLAWKILELYGRTDIPVGVGAEETLLGAPSNAVVRQTLALDPNYSQPAAQRHNGIRLLIDTCMNAQEKVTLLAYGPLTNLALALRAEPRIKGKIERIVLMSGQFYKPRVEYNVVRDAEASWVVYNSGLPILAVGLDVTMECRLSPEDMTRIEKSSRETAKFLWRIIGLWQRGNRDQRPVLHDPLAVASTFRPGLIKTERGVVDVEIKGERNKTYGMTLFRPDPKGTTEVAAEVQSRAFIELFLERVLAAPRLRQ